MDDLLYSQRSHVESEIMQRIAHKEILVAKEDVTESFHEIDERLELVKYSIYVHAHTFMFGPLNFC